MRERERVVPYVTVLKNKISGTGARNVDTAIKISRGKHENSLVGRVTRVRMSSKNRVRKIDVVVSCATPLNFRRVW